MLDTPAHQAAEPALEELSEEDIDIMSIRPMAIQEFEVTTNDDDNSARVDRGLTARIKAYSEELRLEAKMPEFGGALQTTRRPALNEPYRKCSAKNAMLRSSASSASFGL